MSARDVVGLLALACCGANLAQERVTVPDVRALLVAAIHAPDGQAHGVLSGQAADAITQRFNGTTAIHVDVTTLKRYAQQGCRRLNVRIWQDGVQFPGAMTTKRQTMDVGINYCSDGRPPKSLD